MSDTPTIDPSAIDHVTGVGGVDLLRHLAELFFEMTPQRIEAAQHALENGDLETVYRELHALRSGAGNLGATKLTRTSAAIEMQAKAGESKGLDSMLEVLDFQYKQACDELERILKERVDP